MCTQWTVKILLILFALTLGAGILVAEIVTLAEANMETQSKPLIRSECRLAVASVVTGLSCIGVMLTIVPVLYLYGSESYKQAGKGIAVITFNTTLVCKIVTLISCFEQSCKKALHLERPELIFDNGIGILGMQIFTTVAFTVLGGLACVMLCSPDTRDRDLENIGPM
jgi:hypothetical protein